MKNWQRSKEDAHGQWTAKAKKHALGKANGRLQLLELRLQRSGWSRKGALWRWVDGIEAMERRRGCTENRDATATATATASHPTRPRGKWQPMGGGVGQWENVGKAAL